MYRQNQKQKLKIITTEFQQDPRIRSKCSTPKNNDYFKTNNETQLFHAYPYGKLHKNKIKQQENQRTQNKRSAIYRSSNNVNDITYGNANDHFYNFNKDKDKVRNQLEEEINKKVQSYNVVAGTLRQYFKQQKNKEKNNGKLVQTAIQIIKAYTKTQVTQVSPGVTQLINKMLDTIPIPKNRKKSKKLNRSQKVLQKSQIRPRSNSNILPRQKQQESLDQTIKYRQNKSQFRHKRQYSFCNEYKQSETNLKKQIRQLESSLVDLRQQNQMLQQFKAQFQEMSQNDKQDYIAQLEQIVSKQQKLLKNYQQKH